MLVLMAKGPDPNFRVNIRVRWMCPVPFEFDVDVSACMHKGAEDAVSVAAHAQNLEIVMHSRAFHSSVLWKCCFTKMPAGCGQAIRIMICVEICHVLCCFLPERHFWDASAQVPSARAACCISREENTVFQYRADIAQHAPYRKASVSCQPP